MPIERGSNEWFVVEMNSRGIPYLLVDLQTLDHSGFEEQQCEVIRNALFSIVKHAESLEQTALLKQFISTFDKFFRVYRDWNDKGTETSKAATDHRRYHLSKLRQINQEINRDIKTRRRKNRLTVTAADASVARAAYGEFEKIVKFSRPNRFPGLASSVAKVAQLSKGVMAGAA